MFTAPLIENNKYYLFKKYYNITALIAAIVTGIAFNLPHLTNPWIGYPAAFIIYAFFIFYEGKFSKALEKVTSKHKLIIDFDSIRIESQKGIIKKVISLDSVDKIIVQSDYSMPKDNLKTYIDNIKGKYKKYRITVNTKEDQNKFDFFMPSHYMAEEIKKIITHWINSGYDIEVIE